LATINISSDTKLCTARQWQLPTWLLLRCISSAGCNTVNIYQHGQKQLEVEVLREDFAEATAAVSSLHRHVEVDLRSVIRADALRLPRAAGEGESAGGRDGEEDDSTDAADATHTAWVPVGMHFAAKAAIVTPGGARLAARQYKHSWPQHPGRAYGGVSWTLPLRDRPGVGLVEARWYNNSRAAADALTMSWPRRKPRTAAGMRKFGTRVATCADSMALAAADTKFTQAAYETRHVLEGLRPADVDGARTAHAATLKSSLAVCTVNLVTLTDFADNVRAAGRLVSRALRASNHCRSVSAGVVMAWSAAWLAMGICTRQSTGLSLGVATRVTLDGTWYVDT
jgi:hypothetical protein